MRIKVSVILPSLNVESYIDECVMSAINQSIDGLEIICIDAGSTDGTWEKLESYRNVCSKRGVAYKLYKSDIKSYGYQVNLGIREAVGDYIAILETDDFVEQHMYQTLYEIAEENKADYVKADFDQFVACPDGERLYDTVKLWPSGNGSQAIYNQTLEPSQNIYLYKYDNNIWKGIYNRKFLIRNQIVLNESKGAAFQDIGFTHQILASAHRAVYTDASFYRYRMDREDSSINSPNGLKYAYQEFSHILDDPNLLSRMVCKDGLYSHMLQCFLNELRKALCAGNFKLESDAIKPYLEWFTITIKEALEKGFVKPDYYNRPLLDLWNMYYNDQTAYIESIKSKNRDLLMYRKKIKTLTDERGIYVFGAGSRGRDAVKQLKICEKKIIGICDNDEKKWDTEIYGVIITSPEIISKEYFENGGIFFICNKKYSEQIKKQLIGIGVKEQDIVT